jgi:exopolysaccharide biosynthesis polyprenyl glycosylphosphotransferase
MLRRFSVTVALFSMLLDVLVVGASMWLSAVLRPALSQLPGVKLVAATIDWPTPLLLIFPAITVLLFAAFALYDGRKYLRAVNEFAALTLATLALSVSLAGVLYFSFRDVSRATFALFVVLAYGGFLLWRVLARLYFRWRSERDEQRMRRVLIVGAGTLGRQVHDHIRRSAPDNLRLIGFLDDGPHAGADGINILGTTGDLPDLVTGRNITDLVIALPHSAYQHMADVVQLAEPLAVRVWVALRFFDLTLYNTGIEDFSGLPMIDLRAPALSEYQLLIKRAFDLSLTVVGMVVALPLMGLLALLILILDGPPVIFRQARAGENGRSFVIYKFRSMVPGAEAVREPVAAPRVDGDLQNKSPDDPRVTPIGRFLRRTSLDELPQLFNVLRGEMSLVGPRPEMPFLVETYQPWQRKRFSVPPGLTGWWQINGRSDRPMHLNTEDDLYYINNYSIWLDIEILVRTLWVVIVGRGSY